MITTSYTFTSHGRYRWSIFQYERAGELASGVTRTLWGARRQAARARKGLQV